MTGALTQLRLMPSRIAALKTIRDAESAPPDLPALLDVAGLTTAGPIFAGERRVDSAEAALAALSRDRGILIRLLMQAGVALVFVVGLAMTPSPLTRAMAALAACLVAPTLMLVVGAPGTLAELLLAAPIAGRPALDLVHARALSMLALLLGADAEPAIARAAAEAFVGRRLPEPVVVRALSPGGFAQKAALRAESETALLRGSMRLVSSSQIRLRLLLLGIAAIVLAALFAPAFQQALHPPVDDSRPATLQR